MTNLDRRKRTLTRGSPRNWVPALGVKERQSWSYWVQEEVWRHLQPSGYNTPTWRTDRRTDTGRQQRPRLRIASRGKMDCALSYRVRRCPSRNPSVIRDENTNPYEKLRLAFYGYMSCWFISHNCAILTAARFPWAISTRLHFDARKSRGCQIAVASQLQPLR